VIHALKKLGISYKIDNFLVRGLDSYTGTVFEMNFSSLGAQSAVMGGGRYDNLIEELGGKSYPAVGFACGMERLVMLVREKTDKEQKPFGIYIVYPEIEMRNTALGYAESLRGIGYRVDLNFLDRSMKAQMKAASRMNAARVLIVEPEKGVVTVRDMTLSTQNTMKFDEFFNESKNNPSE
jgi:histidyl-tRNA synthetase